MSNFTNQIERLHELFIKLVSSLQSPFLMAIRLYWGWQFTTVGWGKLHNLEQVTGFFRSLQLPAPAFTAAFVSGFEFVGGILLTLGLLSRIQAFGIVIDMSVAYLTADRAAVVAIFSSPDKFYGADPFIFWFVGLIVLIFGPGKYSLDSFLARSIRKKRCIDGVFRATADREEETTSESYEQAGQK